jgi:hypothetical protein
MSGLQSPRYGVTTLSGSARHGHTSHNADFDGDEMNMHFVPQSVTTSTEIEILAGVARHILTPRAEHKAHYRPRRSAPPRVPARRADRAQGVLQPALSLHHSTTAYHPSAARRRDPLHGRLYIRAASCSPTPHIDNGKTVVRGGVEEGVASTEFYRQQSMKRYSVKKTRAPPRVVSYRTTHCRTWVRTG